MLPRHYGIQWSRYVEAGHLHNFGGLGRRGIGLDRPLRRHSGRGRRADAPTLDELLAKMSAMALDLLPDNHPGVDPRELFLQITALREAEPAAA
jgi:hypothetical protein